MSRFILTDAEVEQTRRLLDDLSGRYSSAEDPEFLDLAAVHAHGLPWRLRTCLRRFLLEESPGALCLVSGYQVDEERIGPTPVHWRKHAERSPVLAEEILLVLMGSLLGECIGWATQQEGSLIHDILPIQGLEHEQLGTGSEETLEWHTEDAFHPYRGDYLVMLCLRNPDRVATTFAGLQGIELDDEQRRLLFEAHYTIRPDESHQVKHRSEPGAPLDGVEASFARIEKMSERPDRIAILSGSPDAPYIRIDPYFMDPADDPAAQAALDRLVAVVNQRLTDVVLEPGDFCIIDNYQGIHGRRPFKARYDGTDRWLKRINVTRDLRKSRDSRRSAQSRIIL